MVQEMEMDGGGDVGSAAVASSGLEVAPVEVVSYNIERVSAIFSSLTGEKRRLVRWIGFGGLLRIGVRNRMNDDFSLWLLRIHDPEQMTLRSSRATVLSIGDRDMNLVMDIPYSGIEVDIESRAKPDVMQAIRHKLVLERPQYGITLPFLEEIVTRDYGSVMSHEEEEAFKIATVLYAMSTLLAVEGLRPGIRLSLLNYLVDTSNIKNVNWAGYVLQVIKEAAVSVQHQLESGCKKIVVSGCMLALQIFYIDNMDFGLPSLFHTHLPRVAAYAQGELDRLINMDLDVGNAGFGKTYGLSKARIDNDVIYTRRSRGGDGIHDKCKKKTDDVLCQYFKSCEDFRSKCIKDSEQFMRDSSQSHNLGNAYCDYGSTASSNNNILENFISQLPLVPPLPDVTSSVRNLMPNVSVGAPFNPRKRYKSCAMRSRKKRCVGDRVETAINGTLGSQTSNTFSSPGNPPVSVKEKHNESIIFRQPSPTLFSRLKMRCNRLPTTSHYIESYHSAHAAKVDSGNCGGYKPTLPIYQYATPDCQMAMIPPKESYHSAHAVQVDSGHCGGYKPALPLYQYATPDSPMAMIPPKGCSDGGNYFHCTTDNNLAIVVYDTVAAAARCHTSPRKKDPSMAPKRVSGEPSYTCSPFGAGYNHILPDRKKSRALYKLVESGTNTSLDRVWFRHHSPWLIEISGHSLITQFKRGGTFTEDLVDCISRMHTELDDSLFGTGRKRFRHYLPARFASIVLAGGDFLQSKDIRDAFVGEHLKYDVEHCQHIIAPVPTSSGYSCYIWDIPARDLVVLDPVMMNGDEVRATNKHKKNMDALSNALVKCTQTFFEGWSLEDGDWFQGVDTRNFGGRCRWNNSGLYTMHYARWYAVLGLEKRITDVELGEIRADMFYQLMNMTSNASDFLQLFWRLK